MTVYVYSRGDVDYILTVQLDPKFKRRQTIEGDEYWKRHYYDVSLGRQCRQNADCVVGGVVCEEIAGRCAPLSDSCVGQCIFRLENGSMSCANRFGSGCPVEYYCKLSHNRERISDTAGTCVLRPLGVDYDSTVVRCDRRRGYTKQCTHRQFWPVLINSIL
jgi:hypothetical protein